ncbi:MAG: RNA 2',3'-cyclic phosphodiesterase [Candidatus Cloacimonetes bacterium]|nr:RNA 2',3'-cyclic phosphodiesterase [Candidatus Cloacimonadota bacterium]MDD3097130.1 RNA 2',3'-cyclic phosphodiesterase [Candidatus Cloacimonadota bacterium]HPF09106.1 RNA 2',3'-cyclic phosphodiesterase [Candidatus Cloacimonadota bacterium]
MRMFVALEVPQPLLAELQEALLVFSRLTKAGINWVHPQNLHFTVNFIGEVADHKVAALSNLLANEAAKHEAAYLQAEGYELFPAKFPRLLWLKLNGRDKDLQMLNRQLLSSLRHLGIDADPKALKLHVTLGRIKAQQTPDFERSVLSHPVNNEVLRWDTLTLYRSTLRPDGPIYEEIQQYNLK